MDYYYDCEFLEGQQTKRFLGIPFGKTKPTIDLISIGIVSEDEREYYAISKDFNLKEAWNRWQQRTGQGDRNNIEPREYWIRENVLKPIWVKKCREGFTLNGCPLTPYGVKKLFTYKNFKKLIQKYGKSNEQIAKEVYEFTNPIRFGEDGLCLCNCANTCPNGKTGSAPRCKKDEVVLPVIKLYGYYSAYDHVALCWLFGKMNDLPAEFPMYTTDLEQELSNRLKTYTSVELSRVVCPSCKHNVYQAMDYVKPLITMRECIDDHPKYPKQTNEHDALSDARWNRDLHNFIKSL